VDLWSRLADVRSRWNVLDHPFYVRWTRGELAVEDLALYAGQYRHAVVALAAAADGAARAATAAERAELAAHAGEEAAHVALWDAFAGAAGADGPQAAEPETAECARAWAGEGRDLLGHLVALYAIESAQPAIAETKRAGLLEHYGIEPGPGTQYFEVHAELDHEHAAAHRALLEHEIGKGRDDELLEAARAVLAANWALLDGVDRKQH
jgi:pyrroloquinoline-quinone synthase